MQKQTFRFLLSILMLTGIHFNCHAKKVSGFIITNKQDTLYGTIRLPDVSMASGNFFIKGFDLESLHFLVRFRGRSEKSFHAYSPDSIQEFGFCFDHAYYFFKSFQLEYKSMLKTDRQRSRFLYQAYRGTIALYRIKLSTFIPDRTISREENMKYHEINEYYLYSQLGGLVKVEQNNSTPTVRELLRACDADEEFVQTVPENTSFKEIKSILALYDAWKRSE